MQRHANTHNFNRWHAFALLAVGFFMTIIDLTIVNVSLPTIGRDLRFSETSLQWVVTAYALTFGGFMLLGGRAADLLGRRRILMLGLALFTAASLGCALSTGEAPLIATRAVQGLGAAIEMGMNANAVPTPAIRNGPARFCRKCPWTGTWVAQITPAPISVIPIAITTFGPMRVTRYCERPARATDITEVASHATPDCSAL